MKNIFFIAALILDIVRENSTISQKFLINIFLFLKKSHNYYKHNFFVKRTWKFIKKKKSK